MGYTHYWTFNRAVMSSDDLKIAFKKAVKDIIKLKNELPFDITIKDGHGENEAVIDEDEIWFNGDSEKGEDHETFHVTLKVPDKRYSTQNVNFDFCKTARKPYDILVCASLIALENKMPEAFSFSSDGNKEDWKSAIDFYEKIIGSCNNVKSLQKFT